MGSHDGEVIPVGLESTLPRHLGKIEDRMNNIWPKWWHESQPAMAAKSFQGTPISSGLCLDGIGKPRLVARIVLLAQGVANRSTEVNLD